MARSRSANASARTRTRDGHWSPVHSPGSAPSRAPAHSRIRRRTTSAAVPLNLCDHDSLSSPSGGRLLYGRTTDLRGPASPVSSSILSGTDHTALWRRFGMPRPGLAPEAREIESHRGLLRSSLRPAPVHQRQDSAGQERHRAGQRTRVKPGTGGVGIRRWTSAGKRRAAQNRGCKNHPQGKETRPHKFVHPSQPFNVA